MSDGVVVQPGTSTSSSTSLAGSSSSAADLRKKQADRMAKLRELHNKRNEARKLNHQEVQEEERRAKLPANFEARKRRAEWILNEEEMRKKCEEDGEDFDRVKLLHIQADELERMDRLKARKKNPDQGFSTYEAATVRQHNRLVTNMKVDLAAYQEEKEKVGEEAFYAGRNTLVHGLHQDKQENIDKMVLDLEKQVAKRDKFSRRRMYNDDADIDYINERNMKFNKKIGTILWTVYSRHQK